MKHDKSLWRAFWDWLVLFSGISTASNLSRTRPDSVQRRGLFLFRPGRKSGGGVMPRKYLVALLFICALRGFAESTDRPKSSIGSISGTVIDVNGAIVPEATVVLRCKSPCNAESTVASHTGGFEFSALTLGTRYEIDVSANG